MSTEDESWRDHFASDGMGNGREGRRPYNRDNSTPQGEGGMAGRSRGDRPLRPRISRPVYGASSNGEGRGYGRPEGAYRPRQNNYNPEGGRSAGSYRPRTEGGYNREGATRPEGYRPRQGGYTPRQEGGYNREGGYRPRPEGGYNREGGYAPRQEGGYRPRPEGGYRPRPQGGYGSRPQGQGGYNNRPRRQHSADYNPHAKYSMKKQIEYKEQHYDPEEPLRLNKYLANAGVCSRREADDFIQAGVVSVNGVVVTELGTKVKRSDEVKFHDQTVTIEKKVYVLLNKPKDYVTTSEDPQNRKTVMDLVRNACRERIYPVGRLDRNTTGVLLLTNDGELATKLTHPQYLKKKIYHVYTDKSVSAADMRQIAEGIQLEDGEIHADAIEYVSETDRKQVGIEIHSGRNRIVRRIFESLGYRVLKLDRVFFAGLTKKNVRRGDWRYLTEKEVNMLRMGAFE